MTAAGNAAPGSHAAAPAGLPPEDVNALIEQAQEHVALGQDEDARDCFTLALAHAPECAPALTGLARVLRKAGEVDAALEHVQRALRIAPDDPGLHFEAALTHNRAGNVAGAIAAYQRALELNPEYAAANANLGLIHLAQLGDPHRAQRYFERAIAIDPGGVAAQANLGLALQEQGRVHDALAHYERLISANPAINEYRWNRGLALLGGGDYARGWEDYEMRNARGGGAPPRAFPFPAWHGDALGDAALLIYGEQGIGDEIMFASCVPDLLARGFNCVLECNERLAALFGRSFPSVRVHGAARDGGRAWLGGYPDVRAQTAIGSLPRVLRRDESEFPRHTGYLHADPGRVARWRARLDIDATGHAVGIAWSGGTVKTRRDLRSVPLPQFEPLLDTPGLTFVALQRDAGPDLAALAAARCAKALFYDEALHDMDDSAALIQALDCIVTADNTVAHLAGALGKRVMLMLPYHADWRWLRGRATSPWYPSAALYRQPRAHDWTPVIEKIAADLRSLP